LGWVLRPLGSTETLMRFWLASGLGFALNHIEQAFDKLFGLSGVPDDYTEFDTSALLRSDQKDRIDALVRGVQGGVFSPNEARNQEGLDSVEYGDEPRVQQQVVPLSAVANIPVPCRPARARSRRARVVRRDEELSRRRQPRGRGDDGAPQTSPSRKPVIRKRKRTGYQSSSAVRAVFQRD
jgi:phage portal protein BeeE